MIVLDASAALSGLLNAGPARASLAREQLRAPHLIDSEVASGLSRHVASGSFSAETGWRALDAWRLWASRDIRPAACWNGSGSCATTSPPPTRAMSRSPSLWAAPW